MTALRQHAAAAENANKRSFGVKALIRRGIDCCATL